MTEKAGQVDAAESQSMLPLLEHLARAGRRAYLNEMAPGGLRPRHLIALRLLADLGPQSQLRLAEALSLDPSNVVALLKELEERDLVLRRRDPLDRRRHIIELSGKGQDEVARSLARGVAVEDHLFAALDRDERATLFELLRRAAGTASPACSGEDAPAAD
ncbi:MarR family winged helix-turn-helix transcriptional regulator [Actinacidiphila guanduensis]|uniref:Transcriptional regulator, MarR family n=1 Tax=Actinacidiphila guanduensis TaxID=310781 RepID=A0A1H0PVQ3_9ACTN|nr:MarR family winged helix-turn-helix transcriptional regulator [Actinacidiphila guanduensis]SDP09237.1 transcriptional regulator, MarR family [Actinacidiphila guanduensis]